MENLNGMEHEILNWGKSTELAKRISNLRYDSMAKLFSELHAEITSDYCSDQKNGRKWVAKELYEMLSPLQELERHALELWRICEKFEGLEEISPEVAFDLSMMYGIGEKIEETKSVKVEESIYSSIMDTLISELDLQPMKPNGHTVNGEMGIWEYWKSGIEYNFFFNHGPFRLEIKSNSKENIKNIADVLRLNQFDVKANNIWIYTKKLSNVIYQFTFYLTDKITLEIEKT